MEPPRVFSEAEAAELGALAEVKPPGRARWGWASPSPAVLPSEALAELRAPPAARASSSVPASAALPAPAPEPAREEAAFSEWHAVPEELLDAVFRLLDAQLREWPERGTLLAACGVCRAWRRVGLHVFAPLRWSPSAPHTDWATPARLLVPGPVGTHMKCYIQRERVKGSLKRRYLLFLGAGDGYHRGKFLLCATRTPSALCSVYDISTSVSGEAACVVAQLRSNFFGTQFHVIQRDTATAACATSLALPGAEALLPPPPQQPSCGEAAAEGEAPTSRPASPPLSTSPRGASASTAWLSSPWTSLSRPSSPRSVPVPAAPASAAASADDDAASSAAGDSPPASPNSGVADALAHAAAALSIAPHEPAAEKQQQQNQQQQQQQQQQHAAHAGGSTVVGALSYDCNIWTQRGPRRMAVALSNPLLPALCDARGEPLAAAGAAAAAASAPGDGGAEGGALAPLAEGGEGGGGEAADASDAAGADGGAPTPDGLAGGAADFALLRNKAPRWHDAYQCWCLDFGGRVTQASVKNFQLVAQGEGRVLMQFGRTSHKDVFVMDYEHPLSAVQAFAVCLSAFDSKLACR